jgi:hypothetical protein
MVSGVLRELVRARLIEMAVVAILIVSVAFVAVETLTRHPMM